MLDGGSDEEADEEELAGRSAQRASLTVQRVRYITVSPSDDSIGATPNSKQKFSKMPAQCPPKSLRGP